MPEICRDVPANAGSLSRLFRGCDARGCKELCFVVFAEPVRRDMKSPPWSVMATAAGNRFGSISSSWLIARTPPAEANYRPQFDTPA